jgi:hypothetical protein
MIGAPIIAMDASHLRETLLKCRTGDIDLSLDAATLHGHSVLDCVRLRTMTGRGQTG